MPIGVITCICSVAVGGLCGVWLSKYVNERIASSLTFASGLGAMANGICSVIKATAMPAIVMSIILGVLIGEVLQLNRFVSDFFAKMLKLFPLDRAKIDIQRYVMLTVIFCCSGFGIYGVFTESMTGDPTLLLSKAILDFFTAIIFVQTLGVSVTLIAIPQMVLMFTLYFFGRLLGPAIDPVHMQNFIACGGVLSIAAGLSVSEIKSFPLVNLLPSLVLVIPFTALYLMLF